VAPATRIPAQPQDAFNDYARVVADQMLGMVVELPGRIDADRLGAAARELIAAQPVLGCRFLAEGRNAWHEPVASAGEIGTIEDDDPWSRAIVEAGQPLTADEPHLGITLVRGRASDVLAVRVDHTAADGQGAKACLELLAASYRDELAADPRATATDRSWRRLRRGAGWPRMLVAAARRKGDPRPTWGLPRAGEGTGRRHHDLLTLPAQRSAAIKAWGRERGHTINDIALAAFYRAMFAQLEPAEGEPMVLRVSFDQRRYLDPSDPMPAASNLSSVEPLAIARIAGESFEGTVGRVAAEMTRLKGSSPGLGSALLLEMLYRLQGFTAVGRPMIEGMERGQKAGRTYPFLSNFGVLDDARLAFGELKPARAVVLPIAAHPPFAMLGASSHGGELTLALGFAEGEIDPAVPVALLAFMESDLPV
jgi:NRPS condensation-like uncharacterized protein